MYNNVKFAYFCRMNLMQRKMNSVKKKTDVIYILVNILCLAFLIADIEFKNYFSNLSAAYQSYTYFLILSNLAGPLIVCLLILFGQAYHQKVSLPLGIAVNTCSAVIFLLYNYLLLHFRIPELAPESLVILCLFIGTAIYNIYSTIQLKSSALMLIQENIKNKSKYFLKGL